MNLHEIITELKHEYIKNVGKIPNKVILSDFLYRKLEKESKFNGNIDRINGMKIRNVGFSPIYIEVCYDIELDSKDPNSGLKL